MRKEKAWEYHFYCRLFPVGTDQMLSDLSESISMHGLREEIVTFEGKILDGRNRYLACKLAEVEPIFEEFDTNKHGDNPLQFVIDRNLHRRHLNDHQRSIIAQEVWQKMKEGKVPDTTMEKVAKMFDVSKKSIMT